jgi:hypothetical protein
MSSEAKRQHRRLVKNGKHEMGREVKKEGATGRRSVDMLGLPHDPRCEPDDGAEVKAISWHMQAKRGYGR